MILHHWIFLTNACLVNIALASSQHSCADLNIIGQGQVDSQFQYKIPLFWNIRSQILISGGKRGRGRQLWNIKQQHACLFKSQKSLRKGKKCQQVLRLRVIPSLAALRRCVPFVWHEICTHFITA